ncbi:hypothetical protein M2139_000912 [Enterococcus sp. PF1-24]|uniref:L,D-transpeptidase family protein n=1 Tax=unclassified Enterococcus TaxID=2608891 RepID=UPI0024769780|nr:MULTISPECIES: L,D-transpeptidase family protein [unclassified Enterococcus]MDH6363927.1 hypothetical protein [Enterococcus sp. PFB1-1]MDH6401028.1 hypothetical protein [Enterococcus sp. PF1-24]
MSRVARHQEKQQKSPSNFKFNLNVKDLSVIIPVVIILLLALAYLFGGVYYNNKFTSKTSINGLSVGGLNAKDAQKLLDEHYATQDFSITDDGKEWKSIPFSELGVKANYGDKVATALKEQNNWAWPVALFKKTDLKMEVTSVNIDQLNTSLQPIFTEIGTLNETRKPTKDAALVKTDAGFVIEKEVQGDTIHVNHFHEGMINTLVSGQSELELHDYLHQPGVTTEDTSLKEKEASLNNIAKVNANYSINGQLINIPTTQIMDWLIFENGEISLNQDKLTTYVTDLAINYDTSVTTYGNPSTFNSTLAGEITVPAGTYGWSILIADEVEALKQDILAGGEFTRSPIVDGPTGADHPLIGNTYVEVDLANQHMWYYQDGAVVIETDVVTGRPGMNTVPGVHYVWNKQSPSILRGDNGDGTKYETQVSYWMAIDWIGIGIHDSNWQYAYGGSQYLNGYGSHGCINTPPAIAAQMYDMVAIHTPVIVH